MKDFEQYRHKGYIPFIGIECHVQLKTKTKLFSGVSNDARNAEPNTLVSHICFGLPGALPVLNEQAIDLAIKAGYALNVEAQHFSKFDRKHYFYPDLPKGYQITQFDEPIILGGYVQLPNSDKKIMITRAHLEEDAGKSTHPAGKDYSLVDLNRAGTPLLEIVSEADMHNSNEAKAYAKELFLLMRYAGVSDGDLYHGNMRFDVNVSVTKDPSELGTRTETKNLNSFKSVERAVDFEINRQIELLEKGQTIVQETRGWDDSKQKTFSQRSKEEAHDYRYFPEPDLPPIELSKELLSSIKKSMPVMPGELREKLTKAGITEDTVETLVSEVIAGNLIMDVIETGADKSSIRKAANWLTVDIQALVAEGVLAWDTLRLTSEHLLQLSKLIDESKINSSSAKIILGVLAQEGGEAYEVAKERDLIQSLSDEELEEIVSQVLSDNQQAAQDVKNGETKAIGFLVGQVMKNTKGKANPALVNKLIKKQLSE